MLTNAQKIQVEQYVPLAKRTARRFRVPIGMSREEWEAECLYVLVEALQQTQLNPNFQAHLYVRCKFRRLQLLKKHKPVVSLPAVLASKLKLDTLPNKADLFRRLSQRERNLMDLKLAGFRNEEIGIVFRCSAKTIYRNYLSIVAKLKRFWRQQTGDYQCL
jgi:ATP/maltotriose-dependent transcriptional regulator MalT